MRPTVFIAVSNAFASRFFLQTGIVKTLDAAGVRVVALTPHHRDPRMAEHLDGEEIIFEPLRKRSSQGGGTATALTRVARRNALDGRASRLFREIKYPGERESLRDDWPRRVAVPVDLLIRHLLWRSRALRKLAVRADLRTCGYVGHSDLFNRYQPALVVAPTLGYHALDEAILQEAVNRGVPTAAVIHAWDNPTSRGYKAVDPNLVAVWSPRMRDEVVRFQDVDPRRIAVSGVPHWDHYLRPGAVPSKDELFSQLGLDRTRRLVAFATFVPFTHSYPNAGIAQALARAVEAGELGCDAQLLIRLHPEFMRRPEAAGARAELERLARHHPHVHLQQPQVIADDFTHPARSDARMLGGIVKHCDVLVNGFSTTTLEACLVDRPVVMAGPSAHLDGPSAAGKLAGIAGFEHLRPVIASGAVRTAYDRKELVRHVRAYLADPSLEREARLRLARDVCGPTDGHAGERVGRLLLEQLSRVAGSPPSDEALVRSAAADVRQLQ